MTHVLRLALRYVLHYRGRSAILTACITLTFLFPIAVEWLVESYQSAVGARAASTPLVLGAKGSRYDLVLNTLYFRGRVPSPIAYGEVDAVRESGLARPIPVLAHARAAGFPIVGTSPEYYEFRGLVAARGTLPVLMGDCVLGSEVAAETGLGPGTRLLSEPETVWDLSAPYPLRMSVTGVLAPTGTADDHAVFAGLETAWILEGIGHGHAAAARQGQDRVLRRNGERIVLNASVRKFQEVTPENADSWHFHVPREERPLTGILVVPNDDKSNTLLKGRYRLSKSAQLLVPSAVVEEIFAFVLQIKAFFDAHVLTVTVATILFLLLVVLLSVRLRRREIETLHKIGTARTRIVAIFATELAIVLLAGLVLAVTLATVTVGVLRNLHGV